VSTVGRDEATIRLYIQTQQAEDQRLDQLDMFGGAAPPLGGGRFANRFEQFTSFIPPALPVVHDLRDWGEGVGVSYVGEAVVVRLHARPVAILNPRPESGGLLALKGPLRLAETPLACGRVYVVDEVEKLSPRFGGSSWQRSR
jgi:hypothetical protein